MIQRLTAKASVVQSVGRTVKISVTTFPADRADRARNPERAGEIADEDDEVAFWLRFIDLWQRREGRPATDRMRDALVYAEAKQRARCEANTDVVADRSDESDSVVSH